MIDASYVIERLEDAGATLLALPGKGCLPAGMGSGWPDVVHEVVDAYGYDPERLRPAVPSARSIAEMDEAFAWMRLLPVERRWDTRRRLVLLRALVNPISGRHRWSWKRLERALHLSDTTLMRWHQEAVELIAFQLQDVDSVVKVALEPV